MTASERVLRALRTQAQFELAESAAAVSQAHAASAEARMRVSDVVKRCRAEVRLLREALGRAQINPVLLGAMRGSYQAERRSMQEWRTQLASARKQEQLARDALASVRNRERSVERALEFERRKQRAKQDVAQAALIDDLWLQQAWRRRR